MHWTRILNHHLKDRVDLMTEEDWADVERVAASLQVSNPKISMLYAEVEALIAVTEEISNGTYNRLVN